MEWMYDDQPHHVADCLQADAEGDGPFFDASSDSDWHSDDDEGPRASTVGELNGSAPHASY
jgi:hypothetical protein